jgi:N-acyl-D-aspartate/D-glutamate deacylase
MGERAFEVEANDDDLAKMKGELNRAMDAGAMGFSTSRANAHLTADDRPVASRLATRQEVRELVGAMKGRKSAAFELAQELHPADTPEFDEFYAWLGDLAVDTGVTTTFGVMGSYWRKQIATMEDVQRRGGTMIGQTHSRGVTTLTSFRSSLAFDRLPAWHAFRAKPVEAQLEALKDPQVRAMLVDAIKEGNYSSTAGAEAPRPDWEKFYIYDKVTPPWRSLADLSRETGKHPGEIVIDLAVDSGLDVMFMQPITTATEDDTVQMMRHPLTAMTFSDSGAHVSQIADSSIQSHLIAYFWREKGLIPLEECIQMITSRPASTWGFTDRGVLKAGNVADINIFDPKTFGPMMPEIVHDLPTGARRLSQKARGMKATLVAGEVFIENGEHTGALPGKLLRRADA